MTRLTILCALCSVVCLPIKAGRADEKKEAAPTKTVVRFDVAARPAPKPALRYLLLPDASEIEPGTALQHYLKCFMEQNNFYNSKEAEENRTRWLTMPLKDLPVEKLRNYGGRSLRYADEAARMDRIEWQILPDLKRNGVHTLLPEIQKLRQLAAALKVRLRGEIAERRFDDAIGTIKTMYKLGHQLGSHPTLIGNLVGMSIVMVATGSIEEMIQQPGCPNLYWAFASLPSPLVSVRTGAQGERAWFARDFALVDSHDPATPAQLDKALKAYENYFAHEKAEKRPDFRGWVKKLAGDDKAVEAARKRLVAAGLKADELKKAAAAQVILLDEQREYRERLDDVVKWMTQPYWKAERRYGEDAKRKPALFDGLLPNVEKVHRAEARVEQRLKMLQVLEAVRLYAAAHKGKLPSKLDDVDVSLPVDPITGKAFLYAVKDGKATLSGSPPRGEEKTAAFNVVYEITIAVK